MLPPSAWRHRGPTPIWGSRGPEAAGAWQSSIRSYLVTLSTTLWLADSSFLPVLRRAQLRRQSGADALRIAHLPRGAIGLTPVAAAEGRAAQRAGVSRLGIPFDPRGVIWLPGKGARPGTDRVSPQAGRRPGLIGRRP